VPLVRKPGAARGAAPAPAPEADIVAGLESSSEDERWRAARDAAGQTQHADALAAALRVEPAIRVREAMFTSLARMGQAGVAGVAPLLRSDDAQLRAGALDALRLMVGNTPQLLPPLLADADVDVRILSCELGRMLPGDVATAALCELLQREQDPNVCAAAVDVLAEVGQADALPALAACALRFRDIPFLAFAIQLTAERLGGLQPPRG